MTLFYPLTFSVDQLIAEVRALASEYPDAVYSRPAGCSYLYGEAGPGCGCIFGQAVNRIDPKFNIEDWEDTSIWAVLHDEHDVGTPQQRFWCSVVQSRQDEGMAWGKAVAEADVCYPLD